MKKFYFTAPTATKVENIKKNSKEFDKNLRKLIDGLLIF